MPSSSPNLISGFSGIIDRKIPNIPVVVSQFSASHIYADSDIAFNTKGSGSFLFGYPPDNEVAGGNKRGSYSIDLQFLRYNSYQVNSADYSGLFGIQNNQLDGDNSFIVGNGNTVLSSDSGAYGSINVVGSGGGDILLFVVGKGNELYGNNNLCFGINNTLSSPNNFVLGESNNIVGSLNRVIGYGNATSATGLIFGDYNQTGDYGVAMGWNNLASQINTISFNHSAKSDIVSQVSFASDVFSSVGDRQYSYLIAHASTTDATPALVSCGGSQIEGSTNLIKLSNYQSVRAEIELMAISDTGITKIWSINCLFKRGNGANTISSSILSSNIMLEEIGSISWNYSIGINTTQGAGKINFTGQVATNIRIVAFIKLYQINYA
jgi:hypothetical protein